MHLNRFLACSLAVASFCSMSPHTVFSLGGEDKDKQTPVACAASHPQSAEQRVGAEDTTESAVLGLSTLEEVRGFVDSEQEIPSARREVAVTQDAGRALLRPANRTLLTDLNTLAKNQLIWLHVFCPTTDEVAQLSQLSFKLDLSSNGDAASLARLHALTNLDILSVANLQSTDSLQGFQNLRALNFACSHALQNLGGFHTLKQLKDLNIVQCNNLQNLCGARHLKRLEGLKIQDCYNLKNLSGLLGLKHLTGVHVSKCDRLQSLEGLQNLPALRTLLIESCRTLPNLDGMQGVSNLRTLVIKDCAELKNLGDLQGLINLHTLAIVNCGNLEHLNGVETLVNLQVVAISGLTKTRDVSCLMQCPNLLRASIADCPGVSEEQICVVEAFLRDRKKLRQ